METLQIHHPAVPQTHTGVCRCGRAPSACTSGFGGPPQQSTVLQAVVGRSSTSSATTACKTVLCCGGPPKPPPLCCMTMDAPQIRPAARPPTGLLPSAEGKCVPGAVAPSISPSWICAPGPSCQAVIEKPTGIRGHAAGSWRLRSRCPPCTQQLEALPLYKQQLPVSWCSTRGFALALVS